jgi:hypothetical protein
MRSRLLIVSLLGILATAPASWAQSQAINGSIEGTARDATGAALPNVAITVTNTDTGAQRVLVTSSEGVYRAVLLPLGSYRVKAELAGFKTVERTGLTLSAGRTAVIHFTLEVGAVQEVVSVSAESPVADPGRIDLGRTISETEIRNLPQVARNPFNFALLQPNVTGYENEEFGATRMNANGSQERTNYQIDGNNATQRNRAGLRLFQPSEVMIQEVKVITSGFAPEFGQTTGMVFNAVTPSGTNDFRGSASYRFRRKSFSQRPFTLAATSPKPDTKIDNFTGTLGGPLKRDKWHFYLGYEWLRRDLSQDNINTVLPSTAQALGISSERLQNGIRIATANMIIAKTDLALHPNHRLSARWAVFLQSIPSTGGGGLNTRDVGTDFQDRMDSAAVQLVSNFGSSRLNELRIGYGRRDNPTKPVPLPGVLPVTVTIPGVITFGGGGATEQQFVADSLQFIDSFTWIRGRHNLKAGFDVTLFGDERLEAGLQGTYTFPTIQAYLQARDGINPRSYTNFTQRVGDPSVDYTQSYWSFFLQDDFRVSSSFKLLYGLRYDLFKVPGADPSAPHPYTRRFKLDKNNLAPRAGFSWSFGPEAKTVLRASSGLMYDPPLGLIYENALLVSGKPKLLSVTVTPTQVGAPGFPGNLQSLPPGVQPSRSIVAVDPDYRTQYAVLTNVQLERALTRDLAAGIGYVNSTGRALPVRLNGNVIPTGQALPDGRPVYSRTISAQTRVFPDFDTIDLIRSTARSQYNALTLTLNKRMSHGFQAQASYTLGDAKDDAVMGGAYVIGSTDLAALSDPSDPRRDYSFTSWNVKHTFVVSGVIQPEVKGSGLGARLARDNQLALIVQWNSGLPYNIRSNRDLNLDGISADRPNGIARNSGTLGRVFNVDARYSRFFSLTGRLRSELFVEAKNVFNTKSNRSVNSVVQTDTLGAPLAPIPAGFALTNAYESRQVQLALKLSF